MGMGIYITDGTKEFNSNTFVDAKPENTNNVAEYSAFIMILEVMKNKVDCNIDIFGDSMMVVNQMLGSWQIKSGAYKEHAMRAKEKLSLLKQKNKVTITWIPREQNEKADYQSMKAIGFERRKWK